MEFTEEKMKEYFAFLEALRESGRTNMFGARPYLQAVFSELDDKESNDVLVAWMNSYKKQK
jgi:hypothetical protein